MNARFLFPPGGGPGRRSGPVSFEADHFDLELGQGWSVLVRGEAHRVLQPAELRKLREE